MANQNGYVVSCVMAGYRIYVSSEPWYTENEDGAVRFGRQAATAERDRQNKSCPGWRWQIGKLVPVA